MERTRLFISVAAAILVFIGVAGITSNIVVSLVIATIIVVPIQVQGLLSDRATKKRAIERVAKRDAVLAAEANAQ